MVGTLASPARRSFAAGFEKRFTQVSALLRRPAVLEFLALACCAVIGLVSSYDGYLTIRYGLTCAVAVAMVQILLGCYLVFGEHHVLASLMP